MKTGWFSILLEDDERVNRMGEEAWLLDPVDDGEQAEELGYMGQGLKEVYLLGTEDAQAILDGKILVLSIHGEYVVAIGINHD